MIFSNEYVHSVHAMCLAQNSAFFVRGFNTIRVSRFLHFKVRYWVRSIYCWNTPAAYELVASDTPYVPPPNPGPEFVAPDENLTGPVIAGLERQHTRTLNHFQIYVNLQTALK